jgi:hypothetical protein
MWLSRSIVGIVAVCTVIAVCTVNGCGFRVSSIIHGSKSASEDRVLKEPHVPGSGMNVHTGLGSIEIMADPAAKEVEILARVTASGETDEEAKARLADIEVQVERRKDGVLEIRARPKKAGEPMHGGCAFVIRVPSCDGVRAHSGNGSVTLSALSGEADVDCGLGSITINDHGGKIKAHSGNGAITIRKGAGEVHAKSGLGSITIDSVQGPVDAKSGNGSIAYTGGAENQEPFKLDTGLGSITIRLPSAAKGSIHAESSLGSVTVNGSRKPRSVTGERGSKHIVLSEGGPSCQAHCGNGSVTVTLD